MQLSVKCENGGELKTFDLNTDKDRPITLAELNEKWEDAPEEPKEHWCVTMYGGITHIKDDEEPIDDLIEIGNYFNSKEDAYDAWDKLKAWKRLKDNGFKFKSWRAADLGADKYYFVITAESDGAEKSNLDLLFSGEDGDV